MRTSIKRGKGLEVRVHYALPEADIAEDMLPRLRKASQTARIKGFRRGKVPIDVVKRYYGPQIREQSIEHLAGQTLSGILAESEINCATQPVLESCEPQKDGSVRLIAKLEEYPKLPKIRYRKISIKRPVASVTDKDVDDFIDRLRQQYDTQMEAMRQQAANDDKDGATPKESEQVPPPTDEQFYAHYGVEEGGKEAFRAKVKDEMTTQVEGRANEDVRQQVFDQLVKQHAKMLLPGGLVEREIAHLSENVRNTGGAQNGDEKDQELPEELLKQLRERAERRVKLGLIMRELVERFEIKADEDGVRAYIEERVGEHPQQEELIKWHYTNKEVMSSVESAVIERKLVDHLLGLVKIKDKTVDCTSLLYPEGVPENISGEQEEKVDNDKENNAE